MSKIEITYDALCKDIHTAVHEKIYSLPSEKEMCLRYGVSRQTLRKALERLRLEKVLVSRQGSGYTLTGLLPRQANRLVLLVPGDETYLYPAVIRELSRHFGRLHYQVETVVTGGDTGKEREALEALLQAPPRGIFAWNARSALPSPNADLYHRLSVQGCALVFPAGRAPNISAGKTAPAGYRRGGEMLTEQLLLDGHTSIGLLLTEDDAPGHELYLGWCRALIRRRLPIRDDLVCKLPALRMAGLRHDHAGRLLSGTLSRLPGDVTAMICQSDELAFMLIRALEYRGLSVPDQMSVASFDGSYLRTAGHISLTTMQPAPLSCAQLAAAQMQELLLPGSGDPAPNGWKLLPGGSTMRRS